MDVGPHAGGLVMIAALAIPIALLLGIWMLFF